MTMPPCMVDGIDCTRRYVGCKAECEAWHKYLAVHAEEKEKQRRNKFNPADDFLIEQQARVKQARHRDYMRGYRK